MTTIEQHRADISTTSDALEAAQELVASELEASEERFGKTARHCAPYIVAGLMQGHFELNTEQPNPLHARIHRILDENHYLDSAVS